MSDSSSSVATVESADKIGDEYRASEPVRVLKGFASIRERPGMYLGDTNTNGLHQLFKDIVDTSIDEVLNGHCTKIHVVYGTDGIVSVEDNGRSIPAEVSPETGQTVLEKVLTEIGIERTFDSRGSGSDQRFGGWHAVSAVCANALSVWLECEVKHDGKMYQMRFERGIPTGPPVIIGECGKDEHGTKITWLADKTMFAPALDENGNLNYSPDRMRDRLRELDFLTPEVAISFTDARNGKATETFHFPRGVADFVAHLNDSKTPVHDAIFSVYERDKDETQINVALQFHSGEGETIVAFANNIPLVEGGTPVTGFKTALTRVINRYARKNGFLRTGDANLSGEAVRLGLTAVVSVRAMRLYFYGSWKRRLSNPEMEGKVNRVVGKALAQFFDENPGAARAIVGKISDAAKAR